MIIPPGLTNDSAIIRATARERVQVTSASQTNADRLNALFADDAFADAIGEAVADKLLLVGVI